MLKQVFQVSLVMSGALLLTACTMDDEFMTDTPYQGPVYQSRNVVSNRTTVVMVRNKDHHHKTRYVAPVSSGYQASAPVSTGYQASAPVSTGYQVSPPPSASTGYQVPDETSGPVSTGYQVSGDESEGSHVTGQYNG